MQMHRLALDALFLPCALHPWNAVNYLTWGQFVHQEAPHAPACHELHLRGWEENPVCASECVTQSPSLFLPLRQDECGKPEPAFQKTPNFIIPTRGGGK